MVYSDFAELLKEMLDDTNLLSRKDWMKVLCRSEITIDYWVTDRDFPEPDTLRRIVSVLKASTVPQYIISRLSELSKYKLEDISPCFTRDPIIGGETLEWYMLEPMRMGFENVLRTLPSEEQEEILLQASELCRKARAKLKQDGC